MFNLVSRKKFYKKKMMMMPPPQPSKLEQITQIVKETAWVIGTSAFVIIFPIYVATKL
ncbi:hypothetical protein TVAG_076160 [Trichomonas vaginalis G3]|uniref:Uncharacterized protein n=1 Tax=Trichomonas vaginalis (strain ATCC PRA-98 / G3) TaxID=412133 RepID=A2D9L3_TRIV3|nr:hypothetical protein TVAGG3_0292930 [Trichomonas vaginalis G3]EAY22869.1 hypothetical protein TVAG_076160 [Trichomonas vaginalis G3]KAI5527417.1 hypothetical protein TVAGG3_0292930 [Trichomonas vaginalis G3]|eukprot:XP_001583855.1 hypothetical protein [Trichomonas vaginalis G3]